MEVINSSGCRVSLLNDDNAVAAAPQNHRSLSYTSASSPGVNSWPRTPPLTRSDSSDSRSYSSPSPSPVTPTVLACDSGMTTHRQLQHISDLATRPQLSAHQSFTYAPQAQLQHQHQSYPVLQQPASQLPQKPLDYLQNGVPHLDSHISSAAAAVAAAAKASSTKKNQYPCPVAKQYNCPDYFTTSGHAARHAKKHTGRKDAICPECSKAFTRKDNMEQHRRTHSGGRAAPTTASTAKAQLEAARERKMRQQQQRRRSRSTNLSSSDFALDPQLQSPSPSTFTPVSDHEYPQPPLSHVQQARPELRRSSQDDSVSFSRIASQYTTTTATSPHSLYDSAFSPSLAPALDALALAASRQ